MVTSVKSPLEAVKIGSNGKKLVTGPQYSIFLISNWYWIFVWYFQFWHFCRGDYGNGTQKLIFSKICENIPKLPQSLCPCLYVGIFDRTQQFSKVKFNSFFLNHTNNCKSRLEASTTSGKLIRKSRHSKSSLAPSVSPGVFVHSCKNILKRGELCKVCRTSRKCLAPSVSSGVFFHS